MAALARIASRILPPVGRTRNPTVLASGSTKRSSSASIVRRRRQKADKGFGHPRAAAEACERRRPGLNLNTWVDRRPSLDEPESLRLVVGTQGRAIDAAAAEKLLAGLTPRGLLRFREQDAACSSAGSGSSNLSDPLPNDDVASSYAASLAKGQRGPQLCQQSPAYGTLGLSCCLLPSVVQLASVYRQVEKFAQISAQCGGGRQ